MAEINYEERLRNPIGWRIISRETGKPIRSMDRNEVCKMSFALAYVQAHGSDKFTMLPVFPGDIKNPLMIDYDLPTPAVMAKLKPVETKEPEEKWFIVERQERYRQDIVIQAVNSTEAVRKVRDGYGLEYFPAEYVETLDGNTWDVEEADAGDIPRIEAYYEADEDGRQHIHKNAGVY